jgi:hypothetical protein
MTKKLLPILFLLTGCASLPFRITGWSTPGNKVTFSSGDVTWVEGNPRITCYTKFGFKLADGYFVKIEDEYLVVDEFGKDYVWLEDNDLGNYCTLWEQK